MSDFHYVAVAGNQNTSGQCKTREEAEKWAAGQLGTKPTLTKVYIYRVVACVERENPPITTRAIYDLTPVD
jgi:hypothetical protein